MCVSSSWSVQSKQTQVRTIQQYINNCDYFLAVYFGCEDCDTTLHTWLMHWNASVTYY